MYHPPAEATPREAFLERCDGTFDKAVERLRSLPLEGAAEDLAVTAEMIDWLEAVDIPSLSHDVTESLLTFADLYDAACDLEASNAPASAIGFSWGCAFKMLLVAQTRHQRETGLVAASDPGMSREEFHREHIAPLAAEARRVERTLRRHYRASSGRVRGAHGCNHRRAPRRAARRAAGIRSGTDPGDDSPGESPRRRGQPRHVSHAPTALLERIEVAS